MVMTMHIAHDGEDDPLGEDVLVHLGGWSGQCQHLPADLDFGEIIQNKQQKRDDKKPKEEVIKPNVNRGELCDANPPHRRWTRVCKQVRLRCNCHLGCRDIGTERTHSDFRQRTAA